MRSCELLTTKLNMKMSTEHELFGELHEQEENGLFGNEHRRQYEAQQEALHLSSEDLTIKVKHLIKYLKDNFDDEAKVLFEHMLKPECLKEYPIDAIDYLDKLGTFQNYKGDLWIQN